MTRGNFAVIKNGEVYLSIQFNGDMYPEGKGKYVYEMLKRVNSLPALKKAIKKFDEERFGYGEMGENVTKLEMFEDLDFENEYFKRFNSDYLYIKNLDNTNFEIRERETKKIFSIEPGEIQVWNFGTFVPFEKYKDVLIGLKEECSYRYAENSPVANLIKTIMLGLKSKMETALWNQRHEMTDTPFINSGLKYENDTFSVNAYIWDEDDNTPNFVYKDINVYWYKHYGRGLYVTAGHEISLEDLCSMNEDCIKAIEEDYDIQFK